MLTPICALYPFVAALISNAAQGSKFGAEGVTRARRFTVLAPERCRGPNFLCSARFLFDHRVHDGEHAGGMSRPSALRS